MAERSPIYVVTRALALPAQGIPYFAVAQVATKSGHRAHQHAEVQVLWVLAGSIGFAFGDREHVRLGVGCACVIPANVPHVVTPVARADATAQLIDLRVRDDPTNPVRDFISCLGPQRRFDTQHKVVELAARHMQVAASRGGLVGRAGILAAVWELLGTLAESSSHRRATLGAGAEPESVTGVDPRIEEAENYCRHRLSSPVSVDDVAASVGLSRSQLSRLFQDAYNVGPAERVRQLRVELARHLMSTTTLSVKEIAHACGFTRANHFGRVFHQVTGKTPGQFRGGGRETARIEDRG